MHTPTSPSMPYARFARHPAVRGQFAERLSAHVAYTLQAIEALAGRDVGTAYGLTGGAARQVDEIAARVSVALGSAPAVDGNMAAS